VIEAGNIEYNWLDYIVNATDNANGELLYEVITNTVDYDTPGTYDVSLQVSDQAGNKTIETFMVIVEDTTEPVAEGLDEIIIEAGSVDIEWASIIKVSDNSDGAIIIRVVHDFIEYDTPGYYDVMIELEDESGNIDGFEAFVRVIDTSPPSFDIEDQVIEASMTEEPIDWTLYVENLRDNSDMSIDISVMDDAVDYNTPGQYQVIIRAVDATSNDIQKTFNVTVVDTISPTFDLIEDQIIEAGTEDIDWTTYINNLSDNSDGPLHSSEEDMVDYITPGIYSVTVKVTDDSENQTIQTFNVTVQDTVYPKVSLNPSIDTLQQGSTYYDYGVSVDDITQTNVQITGEVNTDEPGTYVITYHVTDASQNTTIIQRYVNVYEDKTAQIVFSLGDAQTTIQVGQTYIDGTCRVQIDGIDDECTVKENTVDTAQAGVYTVVYTYTYEEVEYTYRRYVFVLEGSNPITLFTPSRKEDDII
jgi:hypothetical protein